VTYAKRTQFRVAELGGGYGGWKVASGEWRVASGPSGDGKAPEQSQFVVVLIVGILSLMTNQGGIEPENKPNFDVNDKSLEC
jgi:hypothetical protein